MTSRGQRRSARKKKALQRASRPLELDLAAFGLTPRPVRLMLRSYERLYEYMSEASSREAAEALARRRLTAAFDDLRNAVAGLDPLDLLEMVRVQNLAADPETYRESEHEGSAAAIELVALAILSESRSMDDSLVSKRDGVTEEVLDRLQVVVGSCIDAGGMLALFRAMAVQDEIAQIGFAIVVREAMVRNPAYPHMVVDTLRSLFSAADVREDCKAAAGVDPHAVLAVIKAEESVRQRRLVAFAESMSLLAHLAEKYPAGPPDDARDEALEALRSMPQRPSQLSALDVAEVAREAGLDEGVVEAVFSLFTLAPTDIADDAVPESFFSGQSPFRLRPVLGLQDGRRVVVHDGLLLHAVQPRIEVALRDAGGDKRYNKARAALVEKSAIDLLLRHAPRAHVYRGLKYFAPDEIRGEFAGGPTYSKLVEGDGLIVVDDVALVVEAKSGKLSDLARTGDVTRLRSDVAKLVVVASDQAERLRELIIADGGLRLRDRSWLDLSRVAEVHTIAVTLEDLSGITTVTSELVNAGLLRQAHLAWTVSLHDLRVISEVVERPTELLLYLRRRTEPRVTAMYRTVDELDLFLYMYRAGLYVEPDPDAVEQELPQVGPPSVADRRRFRQQRPIALPSQTDPLDAWYFYQLGIRETPAPKPASSANATLLQFVDSLAAVGDAGWLSIGATLLEGSSAAQAAFAGHGPRLVAASRRDGLRHTLAVPVGARADEACVLIWFSTTPGAVLESEVRECQRYLSLKKHQLKFRRAAAFVYSSDTGEFVKMLYSNHKWVPDAALDAEVARARLKTAAEGMHRSTVPLNRPRRRRPKG